MPSLTLRQLVNAIGLFVAITVAITTPLVYAAISHAERSELVAFKARLNAARVAKYVYQHGSMWRFHRVRLAELIELPEAPEGSVRQRVFTDQGLLVLEEGPALQTPTFSRSAAIVVGDKVTGRLEVEASARPLILASGLVALFSVALGLLAYFAIRVFPLRVLDRTLNQLEERERELSRTNEHLDAAINNMSHGLAMFDAQQRVIVSNRRYAEMYGLSPDLIEPGTTLREILEHRVKAGLYPGESGTRHIEERLAIANSGEPSVTITEMSDGRVIAIVHQPMKGGGWVTTHEDITERKRAEARIVYLAHHDALTGLPNRVLFRQEMERALSRARRDETLAVLCLDLDYFKSVNDTLGHPIGDALLRAVVGRLRGCVRETDTIARLGGDEFAIVQAGIDDAGAASRLAQRIIEAISAPFDLEGHHVVVGTSVGIALAPVDGQDPDHLLKCADMALYRAKADGRGRFHFFEPEMDARMQARRALELDLRKALGAGEFELFYQPIVCLRTEEVSSVEALLRWRHPQRGTVSPAEFISLTEEIGLIGQIGAWVLKQACSDAMTWPDHVNVAVNLSPVQFKSGTLVLDVLTALADSGLPARRLELEITETVLLQATEATIQTLNQLRALGIRLAMDDFGTGYSSLSYLRKFPFDKIKIDQSFIRELPVASESVAIVKAITGLGTSLGMSTTAEGVETEAQLASLRAEGCTEVQGYLFSKPRPASEVLGMLSAVAGKVRAAA